MKWIAYILAVFLVWLHVYSYVHTHSDKVTSESTMFEAF